MDTSTTTTNTAVSRYAEPGWFTRHVFNPSVQALTSLGVSVYGSRVLEVRGRRSGEIRSTPVNLLRHRGTSYLVAPRGETQWVRNVRAAEGRLRLVKGRRGEDWVAKEIEGAARIEVLRAYLRRWAFEVGVFFDGVGADSTDQELATIADRHPVFRLEPAA